MKEIIVAFIISSGLCGIWLDAPLKVCTWGTPSEDCVIDDCLISEGKVAPSEVKDVLVCSVGVIIEVVSRSSNLAIFNKAPFAN